MPESGIGPSAALEHLAGPVLHDARFLGSPGFFAHMDPPTPWVSWATQLWTASRNQNLLHPDTAPAARDLEQLAVDWLAPSFGMTGGHMTPGSTVANLTAIWAARQAGATAVVSTNEAHLSVGKAAHLLGLEHHKLNDWSAEWSTISDHASIVAVITAGSTSTGSVEPLDAASDAGWRHVDAAWAGPLVFSDQHRSLLAGVEQADSVSVSAHKWLFQPKESALVLFRDVDKAHASVSFGADYLAVPNIGLLGSAGARAVPLLATLLSYGRVGIADWIDTAMEATEELARMVDAHPAFEARTAPQAGVLNWRALSMSPGQLQSQLPPEVFVSTTTIDGETWLRSVGANPMANSPLVFDTIAAIVDEVA